ncbi:MAG: adenosylmethionine decarboxylase [Candidatus Scalindua sp.]
MLGRINLSPMKPLGTQLIAEFIHCSKNILNHKKILEQALEIGIKKCGLTLKSLTSHQFNPVGVTVIAVISESHIAIHTYPEARHASIDIFTCANSSQAVNKLLHFLKSRFKPKTVRVIELLRGNPIEIKEEDWITSFSGSGCGFEVRYHIAKQLLSKRSKYQQIDIIDNENFGKILLLDKDVQITEIDSHIYSWNMIAPLIEAKKSLNKVAILGGGDGGILYELLKHNPGHVVLVDIDEEVIKATKRYLRCICKNAFSDPRAGIVIDDANKFLEKNHGFDAIIYDLTMHPEALTNMGRTTFLNEIFSKVKNSLKKDGIMSLQCCSEFDTATFKLIKRTLSKYFTDITFRKDFITSFCENWIFASAKIK